jgi:hypothetical protein
VNALPYVYRCEHRESGRFYIGYRKANIFPFAEDFGIHYFTSCDEVRQHFNEFKFELLSEYTHELMAYEVEQVLLYQLRRDPLMINGHNFRMKNHISIDPKPVQLLDTSSKRLPKVVHVGPAKRSSPTPKGVKKSKQRVRRNNQKIIG